MDTNKVYRLFSPCIPVKGSRRSAIVDINRHQLFYIPNAWYSILLKDRNRTLGEICEKYGADNRNTIQEIFGLLERNEMVYPFDKEELVYFPPLPLQWDFPSDCSNAILEIGETTDYDVTNAIYQLNSIACFHLQFRIFSEASLPLLEKLLDLSDGTSIRSIQLMFTYDSVINDRLPAWFERYWKLVKVELFGSPENRSIPLKGNLALLIYHANKVLAPENCGVVSTDYFSIEMKHFTESQHHNTCLNRKICIDAEGNIKNCPAMAKSYGNIKDTTLEEAINKPGFKDLWYICKDQIDVCKDCEFRHICTDCRCFIKDPSNIYSQPAKCTYNPYICLWEGQEGYVPVEECGTYSRETGFVPDKKRIAELNKRIWGEE